MRILITGASGFIGRSLCGLLHAGGHVVCAAVRNKVGDIYGVRECIQVGDIDESTDWQKALIGIDVIIHLAARVHVMHDKTLDSFESFNKVNVLGTENLARMAVKAGVKRFVFISSVKVNGEGSDHPYTENDIPKPEDAYGVSKRLAEDFLRTIAKQSIIQVVILRLPLVYGPGVKANFGNLIKLAAAGIPLPFKGVDNQRSLVYLGNVVDAIKVCAEHPLAGDETFLVSDGAAVSTPMLLGMIALAMHKRVLLFSAPKGLLKCIVRCIDYVK